MRLVNRTTCYVWNMLLMGSFICGTCYLGELLHGEPVRYSYVIRGIFYPRNFLPWDLLHMECVTWGTCYSGTCHPGAVYLEDMLSSGTC